MLNPARISEVPKLLPTVTALKPVATAIITRATATAIPEMVVNKPITNEYDAYIVLGVISLTVAAGVYFFGHAFLESILGGPATRLVAEEKQDTLTGSVAITTEAPRELVKALVNSGAKGKVLAQHPDFPAFIDVKGVAPTLATREVLEAQLVRKAGILG